MSTDALTATSVDADTTVSYLGIQGGALVRVPHYVLTYTPQGASDLAALQAIVDTAKVDSRRVEVRNGRCVLDAPLWLCGDPDTFVSGYHRIHFIGEHPGQDEDNGSVGTTIDGKLITTLPVVIVQQARSVNVENTQIVGPNLEPNIYRLTSAPPDWDQTKYLTSGVRSNRYSPQAGICIDPTLHDDYATLNGAGNAYPGLTYFPDQSGSSSNIRMVNLWVRDHAVGVMTSPSGGTYSTNADLVEYVNTHIIDCDIGISLGQSQTRQHTYFGGSISACRICAAGDVHGQKQGVPPRFLGTQFGESYALFSFLDSHGTPMLMDGVRAESIAMLGHWGSGSSSSKSPLIISGSAFSIGFSRYSNAPIAPYILETHAPAKIIGSVFYFDASVYGWAFNFVGSSNNIEFDSVTFDCSANSSIVRPFIGARRLNYLPQSTFKNCYVNASSGTVYALTDSYPRHSPALTRYEVSPSCESAAINADRYAMKFWNSASIVSQAIQAASIVVGADTISFTLTLSADQNSVAIANDILEWRCKEKLSGLANKIIPMLRVTSVTSTAGVSEDVVCSMMFDPDWYDETYAPANAIFYVHDFAFDPAVSFTGDLTSGSATISNLSHTGTTYWKVGDWLYPSTGIRSYSRLTAVGASTLTMNRTASASNTGSELRNGKWVLQT